MKRDTKIAQQLGRRWHHIPKAQQRAWVKRGAKAAAASGKAHRWTSVEAREAAAISALSRKLKRALEKRANEKNS